MQEQTKLEIEFFGAKREVKFDRPKYGWLFEI